MKTLKNPRGYISWTQISMFLQSEEKYYGKYILGEDVYVTKEMTFGKTISTALEDDEATGDLFTDLVVSKIPKLPLREHEIKTELKTPYGVVTLLGKLDAFDENKFIVREYKTGKQPWTQARADKHGQVLLYALLVWLKYKKIPEVWLDWAVTEDSENGVRFTGQVISFRVHITMVEIINYMGTVSKVAVGIDKLYRKSLGL
jgi:hypothetical protein